MRVADLPNWRGYYFPNGTGFKRNRHFIKRAGTIRFGRIPRFQTIRHVSARKRSDTTRIANETLRFFYEMTRFNKEFERFTA